MWMKRNLGILFLLGLLSTAGIAQEGYFVADEFAQVSCEDFLARTDAFFGQLKEQPSGIGLIVLQGNKSTLRRRLKYEDWWFGTLDFRQFNNRSRVKIIRSDEQGDIHVRFIIVPANATTHPYDEMKWDFQLAPGSKAFLYHDDMEQICSSPRFADHYREFLDANPNAYGRIVVRASSIRSFNRGVTDALNRLNGIPRGRLRFIYDREQTSEPYSEFWIVPPKK
jgi:hypothetical protein